MYLATTNRNITSEELKSIFRQLKQQNVNFVIDSWNLNNIIFIDSPVKYNGIASLIKILEEFEIKTLTDIAEHLSKYKIKEIHAKIRKDLKFHEKAIEDRFLRKNKFNPQGIVLYLEAKTKGDKTAIRIGEIINPELPNQNQDVRIDLLLENSTNIQEIADFLRLSVALQCTVYFKNYFAIDEKISQAKKLFKSNKTNYKQIKSINEVKDYFLIGFSLWGKDSEKSLFKAKAGKILLLFGNEERGLLKETMDSCKLVVHLGPKSSEPLRANQAAAYAVGVLNNNK